MAANLGELQLEITANNLKLKDKLRKSEQITKQAADKMAASLGKVEKGGIDAADSMALLEKAASATGLGWLTQVKNIGDFVLALLKTKSALLGNTAALAAETTALGRNSAAQIANAGARATAGAANAAGDATGGDGLTGAVVGGVTGGVVGKSGLGATIKSGAKKAAGLAFNAAKSNPFTAAAAAVAALGVAAFALKKPLANWIEGVGKAEEALAGMTKRAKGADERIATSRKQRAEQTVRDKALFIAQQNINPSSASGLESLRNAGFAQGADVDNQIVIARITEERAKQVRLEGERLAKVKAIAEQEERIAKAKSDQALSFAKIDERNQPGNVLQRAIASIGQKQNRRNELLEAAKNTGLPASLVRQALANSGINLGGGGGDKASVAAGSSSFADVRSIGGLGASSSKRDEGLRTAKKQLTEAESQTKLLKDIKQAQGGGMF